MDDRTRMASRPFRFFDNREKYLLFVTTCGEKWAVAQRIAAEVDCLEPSPPALRVFDAGCGDGTVLASVLQYLHDRHPTVPFVVVGKEISLEDVRLTLDKLPDRFSEHPQTVLAMTNLRYGDAPALRPGQGGGVDRLGWHEVALEGDSTHCFALQLKDLRPRLEEWWKVSTSDRTGNPVYDRPSVLVLYRADQRFALDAVLPRPQAPQADYDLVIAAQPYRARQDAGRKVSMVLEPLARSLAVGGRLVAIQSTGQDPGMEIIRSVWPGEDPFRTPGPMLVRTLLERLASAAPERRYTSDAERNTLFRYGLHVMPTELKEHIGTSTTLAAWNAAAYVAQIDDERLDAAMSEGLYLDATREVLERHGGLWFIDESFVVVREA